MVLQVCALAPGVPALAQQDSGQWVGGRYLVDEFAWNVDVDSLGRVFVDEKGIVLETIPSLTRAKNFPVPQKYLHTRSTSFWYGNALYGLAYGDRQEHEGGTKSRLHTFAKWEEGEWHFLGGFKADANNLLEALPCDDGRFIVVSHYSDLTGNNGPDRTPFMRMSIPEGRQEAKIERPLHHGQDDLAKYMADKDCFSLAWHSKAIVTDSHATLINHKTGLYWCFSLKKASLVKAGNIFKKVTPEMIARGGFRYPVHPVLCANAEKSGTVLISALVEDFFITETNDLDKEMDEMQDRGISFEDVMEYANRRAKELAERNPIMAWYRLYPENGRVERLAEPPEGGSWFRDGGKNDSWRPMPDGSIQFCWLEKTIADKIGESSKEPEKKERDRNESEADGKPS